MKLRPHHAADFYKWGHREQYPDDTRLIYSNFTCRGDRHANVLPDFDHKTVVFGLQGVIQWLLIDKWNADFFQKPHDEVVGSYRRRLQRSLGTAAPDVSHLSALHKLGRLPITIRGLREGSRVPLRVPLYTIRNTLPEYFWLTNFLETQLSAELWKPLTSATTAFEYRRLLDHYTELTGSAPEFVPWQGHDFSMRGMSGIHDATSSGAGHLTSFWGTDTATACDYIDDYYMGMSLPDDYIVGGSVPATEHSVMCAGGKVDELGTIRRLITVVNPTGPVSIVSDTWDFWRVLTEYLPQLRDAILARDGKVVIRPDSGDPVKIICGDPDAPHGSPAWYGAVQLLWQTFGGTLTRTGHKLLDPHIGLIYGDSITLERATRILQRLHEMGFASGNMVFGIGSYTYQAVTRDSFGTAIKATFANVGGVEYELLKDPVTDDGTKKSATGLLRVESVDGEFVLRQQQTWEQEAGGEMVAFLEDGAVRGQENIAEIRWRLHEGRFS